MDGREGGEAKDIRGKKRKVERRDGRGGGLRTTSAQHHWHDGRHQRERASEVSAAGECVRLLQDEADKVCRLPLDTTVAPFAGAVYT